MFTYDCNTININSNLVFTIFDFIFGVVHVVKYLFQSSLSHSTSNEIIVRLFTTHSHINKFGWKFING